MIRHFQPAKKADGAPEVQQMTPIADLDCALGSPVQRNSSTPALFEEATGGATVTGIIGVTMGEVEDGLPGGMGEIPFGTTVPIAKARTDVQWFGQVYDNTTAKTVTGDGSLAGRSFGMIKTSTGTWVVDYADTTHVVLRVVKEVPELNGVIFEFLASAIAA